MTADREKGTIRRRDFISTVPAVAAAIATVPAVMEASANKDSNLTTGKVREYLSGLDGGWVKTDDTVDTFKAGGPDNPVSGIAVGWMSYTWALQKALDLGCNMFITHEPTYYNHRDNDERIFRFEEVARKREFIEKSGLTILRCHDMWDQFPEEGIPMSWGKALELGEPVDGRGYYYVYDGGGRKAVDIVRGLAGRVASMGQPGVQFIGDQDRKVGRIVLGCGAITPMLKFIEDLDADMAICSDDGFTYWRDGAFAVDTGFPVAIVNHPVTEEYGMKLLASRLKKVFPSVPVHHVPQNCMYQVFTA
jgi:putative NIF3 family GTP cyclohydrolase 1 type 2